MISLILPFHDDAERLSATIQDIVQYQKTNPGVVAEVILAHNGGGAIKEQNLPAGFRRLSTPERGIGAGYSVGITAATQPWILLSASDLPFGFSDLESALQTGLIPALYIGSKLHPRSRMKNYSRNRLLLSRIFRLWRKLFLGAKTPADAQGTLLLPTDTAKRILSLTRSRNFFFTVEFIHAALCEGMPVVELPVIYVPRGARSSVSLLSDGAGLFFRTAILGLKRR